MLSFLWFIALLHQFCASFLTEDVRPCDRIVYPECRNISASAAFAGAYLSPLVPQDLLVLNRVSLSCKQSVVSLLCTALHGHCTLSSLGEHALSPCVSMCTQAHQQCEGDMLTNILADLLLVPQLQHHSTFFSQVMACDKTSGHPVRNQPTFLDNDSAEHCVATTAMSVRCREGSRIQLSQCQNHATASESKIRVQQAERVWVYSAKKSKCIKVKATSKLASKSDTFTTRKQCTTASAVVKVLDTSNPLCESIQSRSLEDGNKRFGWKIVDGVCTLVKTVRRAELDGGFPSEKKCVQTCFVDPPEQQCSGRNEIWREDCSDRTCENVIDPEAGTIVCVTTTPGCFCKEGHVRERFSEDAECVRESKCKSTDFADPQTGVVRKNKMAKFLADTVPLSVLFITGPTENQDDDVFYMSGRQAIQISFSKSVIVLGSNFVQEPENGDDDDGSKGLVGSRVNGVSPLLWRCSDDPPPFAQKDERDEVAEEESDNGFSEMPPQGGTLRWVTTTILRFDTTSNWYPNLNCQFKVNPELTGWDGSVVEDEDTARHFYTDALQTGYIRVQSDMAAENTDGQWRTSTPYEIPPDGRLYVGFSSNVELNLEVIESAAQIVGEGGVAHFPEGAVTFEDGAVVFDFDDDTTRLSPNRHYDLILPAGTKIAKEAVIGGLREDIRIPLSGLYPFEFDFSTNDISATNLRLFVRHGLSDATIHQLVEGTVQPFSFTPSLPVTITVLSRTELNLGVDFDFDATFDGNMELSVLHSSMTDRMGQSVEGSTAVFNFRYYDPVYMSPAAHNLFEYTNTDLEVVSLDSYQLVMRGPRAGRWVCSNKPVLRAVNINDDMGSRESIIGLVESTMTSECDMDYIIKTLANGGAEQTVEAPQLGELEVATLSTSGLFGSSGLAVLKSDSQPCCFNTGCTFVRSHCQLYTRNQWGVIATAGTNNQVWIWVRDLQSNDPVENAVVNVFGFRSWLGPSEFNSRRAVHTADTELSGTTDANGRLTLDMTQLINEYGSGSYLAVATGNPGITTQRGNFASILFYPTYQVEDKVRVTGDLLFDRGMYLPDEKVTFKGYVRFHGGSIDSWLQEEEIRNDGVYTFYVATGMDIPSDDPQVPTDKVAIQDVADDTSGKIAPPFPEGSTGSTSGRVAVSVDTNNDILSFEGEFQIPSTENNGVKRLSLLGPNFQSIATTEFVLADPRIPTGELLLAAVDTFFGTTSNGQVKLSIAANTNLGNAARDAKITFRYTLSTYGGYGGTGRGNSETHTGETVEVFSTGTDDSYVLQLPDHILDNFDPEFMAGTLRIEASWFTATRDILEESVTIPVQESDVQASSFAFNSNSIIPGLRSTVRLDIVNGADMTADFFVTPIEADVEIQNSKDFIPTSGITVDSEMELDGTTAIYTVTFTLPTVGRYLVICRYTDGNGYTQYRSARIGRTEYEWRRNPLTSWRGMAPTIKDRTLTQQQSQVEVQWTSPFSSQSVITRWSRCVDTEPVMLPDIQQDDFTIPVPDLSRPRGAQCTVEIMVVTGANPIRDILSQIPDGVHIFSHLLDLNLPQAIVYSYQLTIQQPENPLTVRVTDLPEDNVIQPGQDVTFSVAVESDATEVEGVEVAVWVVDKSTHDLQPPQWDSKTLMNTEREFVNDNAYYTTSVSNYDNLVSPNSINAITESVEERLTANPWSYSYYSFASLSYQSAVRSNYNDLNQDDQLFLSCRSQRLAQLHGLWYSSRPCLGEPAEGIPVSDGGDGNQNSGGGVDEGNGDDVDFTCSKDPHSRYSIQCAAPTAPGDGVTNKAASSSQTIPVRKNFDITTTFEGRLITDQNGKVQVSFKAPDNLGTWLVKVVAVDSKYNFKRETAEIISRKPISLQASFPRFVRYGDQFEAGTSVTYTPTSGGGDQPVDVLLSVTVPKGSPFRVCIDKCVDREAKKTVTVHPLKPMEVTFQFAAKDISGQPETEEQEDTTITITAITGGDADGDAFQHSLTSHPVSQVVFVATSFSVIAGRDTPQIWREALPAAEADSGEVDISVGVGRFPVILSTARALLQESEDMWNSESDIRVTETMLAALFPLAIIPDFINQNNRNEDVDSLVADLLRRVPAVVEQLKHNTEPGYGLQYSSYKSYRSYRNVNLNAYGIYVVRLVSDSLLHHHEYFRSLVAPIVDEHSTFEFDLDDILSGLRDVETSCELGVYEGFVDNIDQFLTCKEREHRWCGPYWYNDLAFTYFTYSVSSKPVSAVPSGVRRASSRLPDSPELNRILESFELLSVVAKWNALSTVAQAYMLIVATMEGVTSSDSTSLLSTVPNQLFNNIRVQGRTAYVSSSGGQHALSMQTNAITLWALLVVNNEFTNSQQLEKVANYIGSGGDGPNIRPYFSFSQRTAVFLMAVLKQYDQARGSVVPDLQVDITNIDEVSVIPSTAQPLEFKQAGQPPLLFSRDWSVFQPKDRNVKVDELPVQFSVAGQGEASFVLGMTFAPLLSNNNAVYFGLLVEKIITLINPVDDSETLWDNVQPLLPGQSIKITIQVSTADDIQGGVQIIDPLGGCIEAVDSNLGDTSNNGRNTNPGTGDGGFGGGVDIAFNKELRTSAAPDSRVMDVQSVPFGDYFWSVPWWRWGFPKQEVYRDRVLCFSSSLTAGTHQCSYYANVVSSGKFTIPPAKAFAVSQPELMGLSESFVMSANPREN